MESSQLRKAKKSIEESREKIAKANQDKTAFFIKCLDMVTCDTSKLLTA